MYNLGHVIGANGVGITSIEKTSTSGLVDTYTITYTDGTTSTYTVTNGKDGQDGGGDIVTSWETVLSDAKVPSEKLTKNTIDTKVNTSDIVNNLTTTASGKVLDARQGKALADLIGDAITYINL